MSKSWYIIHTYSGFERKVKESLESRVKAFGMEDKIGQVLIPTMNGTVIRKDGTSDTKQIPYPGFLLAEIEMTDALEHIVRSTPRNTGFMPSRIAALSEGEARNIIAGGESAFNH